MPSGELTVTVPCPCCGEEIDVRLTGAFTLACHQQNHPPPAFPAPVHYWTLNSTPADAAGDADWTENGTVTYGAGKFGDAALAGQLLRTGGIMEGVNAGMGPYSLSWWAMRESGTSTDGFIQCGALEKIKITNAYSVLIGGLTVSSAQPSDDQWHNAILTVEGGTATLFMDGAQVGQTSPGPFADFESFDDWSLLPSGSGGGVMGFDDVAFFNVVLNPTQIAAIAAGTQSIAQLAGL